MDIDIYEDEQQIYDGAIARVKAVNNGESYDFGDYANLAREYGKILKQLRRVTKISDRTAKTLNTSKHDLLDKVHFDVLTGIYNRRFLDENLTRLIKSISRSGGELSLLMMDIDYFKNYNDTYGHSEGDVCLKAVAKAIAGKTTVNSSPPYRAAKSSALDNAPATASATALRQTSPSL